MSGEGLVKESELEMAQVKAKVDIAMIPEIFHKNKLCGSQELGKYHMFYVKVEQAQKAKVGLAMFI